MNAKIVTMALVVLTMGVATLPAQTFTVLHNFTNNPDGSHPQAGLVLSGNTLYGTTFDVGVWYGTVFSMNANGTGHTVLYSFTNSPDGSHPVADLVLSGGILYGTTENGGSLGVGIVFSIGTNGTGFTVLHSFTSNPDGTYPLAGLVLSGNKLYGTTQYGGYLDNGTVFSVSTNGDDYTVLYVFTGGEDGYNLRAGLVLSGDTLYGTAQLGGSLGSGTVFSIKTNGTDFTVLHSFAGDTDGAYPGASLVVSGDTLYGTTQQGGSQGNGTLFSMKTNGADFTVLHNFAGDTDGANPAAPMILSGNTLYGTTPLGGGGGGGTIFSVGTDGTGYTVLYSLTNDADGSNPYADLLLSGRVLYGTASEGGGGGGGTVFSLQLPPSPVVITNLTYNGDGSVTIYFTGGENTTNRVEAATNLLSSAVWQTLGTNVVGGDGLWRFTDVDAYLYPMRVYRSARP